MNLIQGKLVNPKESDASLHKIPQYINKTLQKPLLSPSLVIDACHKLSLSLPDEAILPVLKSLGMEGPQAKTQLEDLRLLFTRETLASRLQIELGEQYENPITRTPVGASTEVTEQLYPLGVLLHIAAGNMDGLPVFSIIEGLLSGNINLLKLPSVDGGLSVMILQKLCEIEPALAEYIYVFELSSTDLDSIRFLANLANAVVVWGGDEAIQAIRASTPPNTKIIEWGHKLSFAYVTKSGMTQEKLSGLAHNICATRQLLCSSCQGIFLDTPRWSDVLEFGQLFLPILEQAATQFPPISIGAKAQNTLQLYNQNLENIFIENSCVLQGKQASILLQKDQTLTISLQNNTPWVKRLPNQQIISKLHPYKEHLQTAALLCGEDEYAALRNKLWRAGVVRITKGFDMSHTYCGAAHDGDYPLRRYTRTVSSQ